MVMLDGFDAEEVPEFDVIPKGWYTVVIDETERTETRAQDGSAYLKVTFSLLDGPCKGRKLWANVNLWNKNQQAVKIAERELANICRAVGVLAPRDTSELHGVPLGAKVDHEDYRGKPQERLVDFCEASEVPKQQQGADSAEGGGGDAPWAASAPESAPAETEASKGASADNDDLPF